MRFLRSARFWVVVGSIALLGLALSRFVEIQLPARPHGTIEDVTRLRERDDLNVVFILVDTLRSDRLGMYGYERNTSPVMDRLAQHGVRFAHPLAQSTWTKTSMASLWTGTYPVTNRVLRYPHAIPDAARMPAEILREAGYKTAGIFRNGWLESTFGFAQGFDLYIRPPAAQTPAEIERLNPSAHALKGNDWDVTQSALEFIRSNADAKFFLYLHYMDVHQYVYEERSGLFGTSYSDLYDNAIHWTDRNIEALVAALEDHGIMDRTLVIIASDHGEAFYEHGLEGHARNLYGEVVETPLVFILPFLLEEGVVVETPVENVDIWPTVLDLLGLPPLPGAQGRSLVPLMLGEAGSDRSRFTHLDVTWGMQGSEPAPLVGVRDERFSGFYTVKTGRLKELYDLRVDPDEQNNIVDVEPARVASLEGEATRYLKADRPPWEDAPREVELDEVRLGILRALGYVIEREPKEEEGPADTDGEAPADGNAP